MLSNSIWLDGNWLYVKIALSYITFTFSYLRNLISTFLYETWEMRGAQRNSRVSFHSKKSSLQHYFWIRSVRVSRAGTGIGFGVHWVGGNKAGWWLLNKNSSLRNNKGSIIIRKYRNWYSWKLVLRCNWLVEYLDLRVTNTQKKKNLVI